VKKSIQLCLGVLCDPLSKQLRGSGCSKHRIAIWQQVSDSISLLSIKGYITPSQAMKAKNRLHKQIAKMVLEKNLT